MKNKRAMGSIFVASSLFAALLSGCGGSANHANSIFIEPRSVTLSPGQTQVFSGGTVEFPGLTCYWKLREGDSAGSFTTVANPQNALSPSSAVMYTAPTVKGTYHLQVRVDRDMSGDSAEATIQVR